MIQIRARNNLNIPVRLTITAQGSRNEEVLIVIGEEGATLKDYFMVCVDADLPATKEYYDVGNLEIETSHRLSFRGESPKEEQP